MTEPRQPSRALWIVALVVGVVCAGALAIALWVERDTVPVEKLPRGTESSGSDLGIGIAIGIGIGIAIGSILAVRRREPRVQEDGEKRARSPEREAE